MPLMDSSGPSSSSTIDPLTQRHLLALPSVFQSVSPTVAALHLARARLLLSISAHEQLFDGWCHNCGGLREGVGGTSKKKRKGNTVNQSGKGVQRKAARCTICGESFRRARPGSVSKCRFPSARIARKVQLAAAATSGMETSIPDIDPSAATLLSTAILSSTPAPIMSPHTISHVLTSPPTPPTYTQPAPLVQLEKKGTRKKKKSGLAKLLAENKERTEREQAGGSWGLR